MYFYKGLRDVVLVIGSFRSCLFPVFPALGLRTPIVSLGVSRASVRFSGGKAASDDSLLSRDTGADRFIASDRREKPLPIPQEAGMVWRTTGWAPDAHFWDAMGGYPSEREVRAYYREMQRDGEQADKTAYKPEKKAKKVLKASAEEEPKVVKTPTATQSTQPKSRVSYREINPTFLEALIKARKEDIRGNKEKKRPIVYGLYAGEDQSSQKKGTVGIQTDIDKTDPRAITGRQIETWIEARQRDQVKDNEEWLE